MKILLLIGGLISSLILGGVIYEYVSSRHAIDFTIEDKYEVHLIADECGTCFLDWQIDYTIYIKTLASGKTSKYKFWMGHGPYIEFHLPQDKNAQLLIFGYEFNGGHNYLIDLEKQSIKELFFEGPTKFNGFKVKYVLNNEFEIEHRH